MNADFGTAVEVFGFRKLGQRLRTGGLLATTLLGLACGAGDSPIGPEAPAASLDPTSYNASPDSPTVAGNGEEFTSATGMTPSAATSCNTDRTALQFGGFFEGSTPFSRWSVNEADATPHSHTHSTSVRRECSGSARIELWKSGPQEGTSYRSEIKVLQDTANGGVSVPSGQSVVGKLGTEMWMGWSIYVPSDFVFETKGNTQETVTQVKAGSSGRGPIWEMQIDKGTFRVASRWGTTNPAPYAYVGTRPITKGAWHDFVLHAKWASGNTGFIEMWMNGTKFVDRHNVPTAFSDWDSMGTHYLKMGIYKWSWKYTNSIVTKRVLYFDSVRITNGARGSYGVVAPR